MKKGGYSRLLSNNTLSKSGRDVLRSISHVIEDQDHSDHCMIMMTQDKTQTSQQYIKSFLTTVY